MNRKYKYCVRSETEKDLSVAKLSQAPALAQLS
jgi:hypothetical protein